MWIGLNTGQKHLTQLRYAEDLLEETVSVLRGDLDKRKRVRLNKLLPGRVKKVFQARMGYLKARRAILNEEPYASKLAKLKREFEALDREEAALRASGTDGILREPRYSAGV
jgi:hypothetical protein